MSTNGTDMRLQHNTPSNPMLLDIASNSSAHAHSSPHSNSDPAGFSSLLRQTRAAAPKPPEPVRQASAAPSPAPAPSPQAGAAPKPEAAPKAPDQAKAPEQNHAKQDASTGATHTTDGTDATEADGVDHARGAAKAPARASGAALDADNALADTTTPGARHAHAGKSAAGSDADASASTTDKDAMPHAAHGTPADAAALSPWLAAMQPRTAATAKMPEGAAGKAGTDKSLARAADGANQGSELSTTTLAAAQAKDALAGADPRHPIESGATSFAAIAAEANAAAAAQASAPATARLTETSSATAREIDPTSAAGALLAGAPLAPAGAAADAAAPTAVAIATPVDAPDFAQALGLQMSVLAKDGVQHAELHLNPADMGPVSVQIVMDGTQARIDFGADMAATRHAIESGLPELASALRDAGFTLAGGGVSQHAQQQARDQGQGGNGGRGSNSNGQDARPASSDGVARVATAARKIVTNGGLDLYA